MIDLRSQAGNALLAQYSCQCCAGDGGRFCLLSCSGWKPGILFVIYLADIQIFTENSSLEYVDSVRVVMIRMRCDSSTTWYLCKEFAWKMSELWLCVSGLSPSQYEIFRFFLELPIFIGNSSRLQPNSCSPFLHAKKHRDGAFSKEFGSCRWEQYRWWGWWRQRGC